MSRFKNRLEDYEIRFGEVRRMPASEADMDHGIVGLKVEYDYQDDPKDLATRIAELHQDIQVFRAEATSYANQARSERQKANELRDVMRQIAEDPSRESLVLINPRTGRPRRMNPYKEYSVAALQEQLEQHEADAAEFDATSRKKQQAMAEAQRELRVVEKALSRKQG